MTAWPRTPRFALPALLCAVLLLFSLGVRQLEHPAVAAAATDPKQQGAELFAARGCTYCHGSDGTGTDRAPSLRNLRKKLPADRIHEQIVHGGQGMPAFGDALPPPEIDALVAFLRNKTWITPPKPATPPAATSPAPSSSATNPAADPSL